MKRKTVFSILLIFIVTLNCKQVYEVDITQPSSDTVPYHVFFINRNLDDNLGVIVTDTNKREINLFYGEKNSKGSLINIQQVLSYIPEYELFLNIELDENLLPKKISSSRNDSTTTMNFKNYDLKSLTVDVDIFDTQNVLIQSKTKIWCGNAILKFKEAKKQLDDKKGMRLAATENINEECSPFLNSIITASNGIGCFVGIVALPLTGLSSLTGIGTALFAANLLLTTKTCNDGVLGIVSIFKGECLDENSWLDGLSTSSDCAKVLNVLNIKSVIKNPKKLKDLFEIKKIKGCVASIIDYLGKTWNEYKYPSLPNVPFSSSDVYQGGKSFGDPNLVTFDGKAYTFNGVGEFVAVKSTTDNFEIQVRQEEIKNRNGSSSVSWNTGLAINTSSDKLCFYPNKYFINGTQYAYKSNTDQGLQNGGSVTGDAKTLTINANGGDIIKIINYNDALDYSIIPSIQRQGKMIGLFGDYNKNINNDLQIRNGATIDGTYSSLYPTFSDSWRIAQAQSLFVYDAGKNTSSYTDKGFPRALLVITASQRANAEQICKNAGVAAPFLEGCINDVVATGDASIAQRAKGLQDESIVRSFDIQFGANYDKSLLKNTFTASQYGPDYLLCERNIYPIINKSISIMKGFETVIYFASETPDAGLSFNLRKFEWSWDVTSTNLSDRYRFYDPLYYLFETIDSKIAIFDGKPHKVEIKSAINLSDKTSTYKVLFDDVLVKERVNFAIRRYQYQDVLLTPQQDVYLSFDSKVKLYRWSFKSY